MENNYAEDFYEIIEALRLNESILRDVRELIVDKEIVAKALEGGNRKQKFKEILLELVNDEISLEESYVLVEKELGEETSIHQGNKRVFSDGWGERLIRTNLSKFYNQAVLLEIIESGGRVCFIPYSKYEDPESPCTAIAGKENDANILLQRLVENYEEGNFTREIKIPNHPHCTHVVIPVSEIK